MNILRRLAGNFIVNRFSLKFAHILIMALSTDMCNFERGYSTSPNFFIREKLYSGASKILKLFVNNNLTNVYQLFLWIITSSRNRMDLPRKQIIGLKNVVKITNHFFLATRIKICQEIPLSTPVWTDCMSVSRAIKL